MPQKQNYFEVRAAQAANFKLKKNYFGLDFQKFFAKM
jgi:hypothetical protein